MTVVAVMAVLASPSKALQRSDHGKQRLGQRT